MEVSVDGGSKVSVDLGSKHGGQCRCFIQAWRSVSMLNPSIEVSVDVGSKHGSQHIAFEMSNLLSK